MEALGLPLRDIEAKYTISEVTLMAWRSQEQGHQMRARSDKARKSVAHTHTPESNKRIQHLEQLSDTMDKPLVDKDGDFTLKHQSGEDAAKFLAAMGFPVSSFGR
jgi:hypothetical protein